MISVKNHQIPPTRRVDVACDKGHWVSSLAKVLRRKYLGVKAGPLSEKSAGDEPDGIGEGELVLQNPLVTRTRWRGQPLVGCEPEKKRKNHRSFSPVIPFFLFHLPGHHEKAKADENVGTCGRRRKK